ncbi:DUF5955 family protein [Streptomyces sp. TRM70308]|uniref:DUF5955 family protein n=1 Tax=Streptomyces sp. TRM70308 TaxID=3131932 RepID=UPI003D03E88C
MEPTAVRHQRAWRAETVRAEADPRTAGLRAAALRMRRELAVHPGALADREVAEEQLAAIEAMTVGTVELAELRRALLLTVSALGSVSALTEPLDELRAAIALFGALPPRS